MINMEDKMIASAFPAHLLYICETWAVTAEEWYRNTEEEKEKKG